MSLDLKRRLIARRVASSRLLCNHIDGGAKTRGATRSGSCCFSFGLS